MILQSGTRRSYRISRSCEEFSLPGVVADDVWVSRTPSNGTHNRIAIPLTRVLRSSTSGERYKPSNVCRAMTPHVPSLSGSSVRNIPSFQVLHNVFIKSTTTSLCSTVLDAISTIFHSDPANYFILEPQSTLNQFAEKIHLKSPEVQVIIPM